MERIEAWGGYEEGGGEETEEGRILKMIMHILEGRGRQRETRGGGGGRRRVRVRKM